MERRITTDRKEKASLVKNFKSVLKTCFQKPGDQRKRTDVHKGSGRHQILKKWQINWR